MSEHQELAKTDAQTICSFLSHLSLLLPPGSPGRVGLVEPLYEVVREDVVVMLSLCHQEVGSQQHHQG